MKPQMNTDGHRSEGQTQCLGLTRMVKPVPSLRVSIRIIARRDDFAGRLGARTSLAAGARNHRSAFDLSEAESRSKGAADRNVRAPFGCGVAALCNICVYLCPSVVSLFEPASQRPDLE
ncbi:MAG: hypothetical protein HYY24_23525 [Verrucomicrobia bacterium]|nr:hypothetical protein [Verrucomicrobiota bacterium]